ncbi:GFA family protein [Inquilinus sp. CAU 1745]|uniref:GFA family protein n=1 Tax=Inquilinus sp. CAU 1745 TaxID=3140369 RepID=UPI00325BB534
MTRSEPESVLTGGCQCGAIRYALDRPPQEIYVCHCRECRKQSASAFGISVMVRSVDLRLLQGTLRRWSRPTDSGRTLACFFCAECGSRVWHGDPEQAEEISIKGGSLDEPVDLSDAIHIWTSRKLPGVIIPEGSRRHEEEPD